MTPCTEVKVVSIKSNYVLVLVNVTEILFLSICAKQYQMFMIHPDIKAVMHKSIRTEHAIQSKGRRANVLEPFVIHLILLICAVHNKHLAILWMERL